MVKRKPQKHSVSELSSLREILLYGEEKYMFLRDKQVQVLETCDDAELIDQLWVNWFGEQKLSQYRSDRAFIEEMLKYLALVSGGDEGLVTTSPLAWEGFRVDTLILRFERALELGIDGIDEIEGKI